jgi:hypothetical protein
MAYKLLTKVLNSILYKFQKSPPYMQPYSSKGFPKNQMHIPIPRNYLFFIFYEVSMAKFH